MHAHYIIKNKNINDHLTINKKYNDKYKDLNIIELIEKIKVIPDLYIKIFDINYDINNNKKLVRDNRIIFAE